MRGSAAGIRSRNALIPTVMAFVLLLALPAKDGAAESQESKGLRIVAIQREVSNKIPVINFTIKNNSSKSQILNRLKVVILEYRPYASIPKTRVLDRLAMWNVVLPFGKAEFVIAARQPVLIESDDAATLGISFSCSYHGMRISPFDVATYVVYLSFMSESGLHVDSDPETF